MSIDKIKKIVSYQNKKLEEPVVNLAYVEFISSDDERLIREAKKQNRDLLVDIFLGEKKESDWDNRSPLDFNSSFNSDPSIGIIAPKVMSVQSKVNDIKSYEDIYEDLVLFINRNTKNPKKTPNLNSLDLKLQSGTSSLLENHQTDIRKIITRINMCSSFIAMDGRIGPANFILVGYENWEYFREIESMTNGDNNFGQVMGMKIIYDKNIDRNKVILGRKNNLDQSGIHIVEDLENKKYTVIETYSWIKQFCWFNIN